MTGIRRTDNERSDREPTRYMVCSQFAICSFNATYSNITNCNSSAMMQGVQGDAILKSKAHLGVLTAAATIVSVAPAFAQTGKTRVVSDEVRERCRTQVRALGIRGMSGGGTAEKQRDAILRQCLANGGRL